MADSEAPPEDSTLAADSTLAEDSPLAETLPEEPIPVVGLGASAGGLIALEQFLSNVPDDPEVAFVVVTHQHPNHPTLLHELLGRKTRMPVHLHEGITTIERGHVYVAPPGRVLQIAGNRLHAVERDLETPLYLPIDVFFRSLAEDRREQAIGVILSGTGADGTVGLKEIKAALGLVMAQDEASAGYPGMPHSAIQTGLVDYVLPPQEMPAQLLAFLHGAGRLGAGLAPSMASRAFEGIFLLLRRHSGNDFSHYKLSTVQRRIERRMNVRHVTSVSAYLELLREQPEELELLFHDLLIGVTSFFRDPEAFDALAAHLPDLIESPEQGPVVRVWIPGCSTGEEAYSIAMLLCEHMDRRKRSFDVQIFATDLDATAIDIARRGVYPLGIVHHVTPERLTRFFTREDDAFRIKKEVRELLVFSTQNLVADPPFTKLDLLSCRNLLIYLDATLQQRLIPLFHYALRTNGLLFLGSSESLGLFSGEFDTVDKKWKLFRRNDTPARRHVAALAPTTIPTSPWRRAPTRAADITAGIPPAATSERILLHELVPPTVIVTDHGDLLHVHGRTGRFLEPAPGAPQTASIFDMAREGLRLELSAAIRQALSQDSEVVRRDVHVGTNGGTVVVDLRVRRVRDSDRFRDLLLITFDHARLPLADGESPPEESGPRLDRLAELELELQHTRESHQGTIEELETSNEELKSTNEELQSTNEELQSANEELETSKEEMQSLNEELQTVNAELQGKIEELSRANDDMKNLLNGTNIATVFLDDKLNIKRFTEQAKHVIHLIPSDVGRPIGDLVSRLRYDRLVEDAQEVMTTLVFKEAEVRAEADRWYLMRILPYRTTDNVIDGLVLTFVDITKTKALQRSETRLNQLLQTSPTAILGQDLELRYAWVAGSAFGRAGIVGQQDTDLFGADEAEQLIRLKRRVLETGTPRREAVELTVDGERCTYDLYLQPLGLDGEGPKELASIVTRMSSQSHEP